MRLLEFIFADDVRQEIGNKASIMGIYGDDMVLNQPSIKWPFPLRLGIYIRVQVDSDDHIPDKFSLQISKDKKKIAHMEGSIEIIEKGKFIALPFVIFPLPLSGPGVMKFDFALLSKEVKLLKASKSLDIRVQ